MRFFNKILNRKDKEKIWIGEKVITEKVRIGERKYIVYSDKFYKNYPTSTLNDFKHSNCEVFKEEKYVESFFDVLRRYSVKRKINLLADIVYNIRKVEDGYEVMCYLCHYRLNKEGTDIISHRPNR